MTSSRSHWRKLTPTLVSGFGGSLYFLGFLGFGFWPLLFFFLVPLWWSLDFDRNSSIPRALGLGFTFGFVAFAGGHLWLFRLVELFLAGNVVLGGALWLLYGIGFASGFAAYAGLFVLLRRRKTGLAISGIAPLLLLEWLQPWPFPVHCGAGLVELTPLVQVADLGGTLLLSGLVGVVNLVVFETAAWLRARRRMPRRVWLLSASLFLTVVFYGSLRTAQLDARIETSASLRVGVVQANLGKLEKRTQAIVSHRRHLAQSREMLSEGEIDLIVWPETAYTRALRGPLPLSGSLIRDDLDVPLLFGATLLDRPGPDHVQYNGALLVDRSGMIQHAYRKNLLIPIAETLPLAGLFPGLSDMLPHAQHFAASSATPGLLLDDWKISVPICYEAVRPEFVRKMVLEAQANLLVTLANDAWFGDSQEPLLHLQLARMRAIEHRLYLVRATNSGISAIIDPVGRVVVRTGVFESANLRGTVHRMEHSTVYGRLGNWPGLLASVFVGLALVRRSGS